MAARGYEFYLRVLKVSHTSEPIIKTRCTCMDKHFRRFWRQTLASAFDIVKMVLKADTA